MFTAWTGCVQVTIVGLIAGIIGLVLVFVYSLFYYRALGVLTILSLVLSGVIVYAVLVLLGRSIGFTLDLSGVAPSAPLAMDPRLVSAARGHSLDMSARNYFGHIDPAGNGPWTWHSLRHVLCTTALFTWKLDATDVSAMAGHANVRTTLLMYVGSTAGVLDRARQATD